MGFVIGHKLGTTLAIDNYLLLGESVDESLLKEINEGKYDYLLPLREIKGDYRDGLQNLTVQLRCEVRKLNPLLNHLKTVRHHDHFIDLVVQMIDLMESLTDDNMSIDNLFFSRDGQNIFLTEEGDLRAIYWPLSNTRVENDPWDFFYVLPYMMRNEILHANRFFMLYWNRIEHYRHLEFSTQKLLSVLKESSNSLNYGEFLPRNIKEQNTKSKAQASKPAESLEAKTNIDPQDFMEGTVILSAEELGLSSTLAVGTEMEINSTMPMSFMNGSDASSFMSGTILLDQEGSGGAQQSYFDDGDEPYLGATVILDE